MITTDVAVVSARWSLPRLLVKGVAASRRFGDLPASGLLDRFSTEEQLLSVSRPLFDHLFNIMCALRRRVVTHLILLPVRAKTDKARQTGSCAGHFRAVACDPKPHHSILSDE